MWQPLWILNIFKNLTLKQVFQETIIFLKRLEYHLLVHSTNEWKRNISIQNCSSKAYVNTNWMGSRKWTYHKDPLLPLITLKIQFEYKNLL